MFPCLAHLFRSEITADPWWESNAVAALIGTATALIVTYVTEMFLRRRSEVDSLQAHTNTLNTAKNEIEFYIDKLRLVEAQLANAALAMTMESQSFMLPSFRLDSTLLEALRLSLSSHTSSPQIILRLTKCAYELKHVQNRLDQIFERLHLIRQKVRSDHFARVVREECVGNVLAANELARDAVTFFTDSVPIFDCELNTNHLRLKDLKNFKILPFEI
jgi:prefoldin subunit 5